MDIWKKMWVGVFFWTQCIWPQSEQIVTQLRKLSRFIHRDLYWSSLQLWYAFHWCMPLKILRTFQPKTTARTRCWSQDQGEEFINVLEDPRPSMTTIAFRTLSLLISMYYLTTHYNKQQCQFPWLRLPVVRKEMKNEWKKTADKSVKKYQTQQCKNSNVRNEWWLQHPVIACTCNSL